MNFFANDIQNACKVEIGKNNGLVQNTLAGLQAYSVLRTASCLTDQKQDSSQDSYCYVNAVQARNPGDLYYYSVPLGISLPNGTQSSCSACVKTVLTVYDTAHQQGNVPGLQKTYDDTIQKTQLACGLSYINSVNAASGRRASADGAMWIAIIGMVLATGILGLS